MSDEKQLNEWALKTKARRERLKQNPEEWERYVALNRAAAKRRRDDPVVGAKIRQYKRRASREALELAKQAGVEAITGLRAKRREAARKSFEKLLEAQAALERGECVAPEMVARIARRKEYLQRQYEAQKKRRNASIELRILQQLRVRINDAIRGRAAKSARTEELIGCSITKLMQHVQAKFKPGMDWSNYGHGRGKWGLDHVVPCAAFSLRDPEQQKACFHYANLEPMWFEDNCAKNSFHNGRRYFHDDHVG